MAGISQEVAPDDVLPMLARNAFMYGYREGRETEFLVLVDRYVQQARELRRLSDANSTIRVSSCTDAAELIKILGYKFQQGCSQITAALVTENAERAFLTIDSGFPLTELEQSLQKNTPFTYFFPETPVPIFFTEKDWASITSWNPKSGRNLLDILLHDRDLARLYGAMGKCDPQTRSVLRQSPGLKRLMSSVAVLDLYGSQISINSGVVVLPGGDEKSWESLVEANPHSPGEFISHLLMKDGGSLAAYFDVLARLNSTQQAHITEGKLLRRFYNAYRSGGDHFAASRGVFPRNAELLGLLTSVKWLTDGDFAIPGDLSVWNEILSQMAKSKEMRGRLGRSLGWDTSGELLETLVASTNSPSGGGPVQVFLLLSALNSGRPPERQVSDDTEKLVARRFSQFSRWFPIFVEFPALDDTSISQFVNAADRVNGISNSALHANALGAFQANIGLWQILARQRQIPNDLLNSSWQNAVQPFLAISSSIQLFEATRTSLQSIVASATSGNGNLSQVQIIDLLAGPSHNDPDSQRVHRDLAQRIRAVLDDQRLVSLDTLFELFDGMANTSNGSQVDNALLPLAESLREFEMPRPIFTGGEKSSWAPTVYTSRHAELQVRTDLTKLLKSLASPSQLQAARGQLTPFLRDTLVGLNYAYYEPPGAEAIHNNPLLVRSHDFTSMSVQGDEEIWGVPRSVGVGATAGGGAYLLGSLADLPYALASLEEDFIVPRNVQALIWRQIVPDLLVGATLPRWWNVSQNELHFAALYQRAGEELLAASRSDADLRSKVKAILSDRMAPVRLTRIERALQTNEKIPPTPPADLFHLAVEFRKRYPTPASSWGPANTELEELSRKYPDDGKSERLSADFGVPLPALILSNSCGLLNMKPISTFGGNAGRLFAESWDSNNLYWARLADEMGYSPVTLNLLVPRLTGNMVANIFASNIDDWSALLRAMDETGDAFRSGKITLQEGATIAKQSTPGTDRIE